MKKKIFVVENDESILEIVASLLICEGYDVKTRRTAEGIYEQIEQYKPNVILLDIIRPTDVGTELCRTLKADRRTKHIPVIVMSTHNKVAETIKSVCADEVVPKPFDIFDLLNTIELQLA
ncbi:MAG: response regulator [Bacteroidota bacterium]|nr:response regulator [Bacteroidota bacterium]